MEEEKALRALADALASKAKAENRVRPKLRLVPAPPASAFDSITRDSILRRIRFLSRSYSLQWLIDQETFNQPSIECLNDDQLSMLLKLMERARECVTEGIPFEDADLVRSNADDLPDHW